MTQVGRALAQRYIRHVDAYSPEARGRSKRLLATVQDRLVEALADAGIDTITVANRFIAETCLPAHDRRFAVEAAELGTALLPSKGGDLAEILCRQEDRVVGNDHTVTFGRLFPQIEPSPLRRHFVHARRSVIQRD